MSQKKKYRVLFMGTPEFAVPTLEALFEDSEIEVPLVISQPDSKRGRKMQLTPSAVKKKALDLNIPVETPVKVSTDEYKEKIKSLNVDAVVVLAYGQLLKQSLLDVLPNMFINIHASLLPRWRGAAPVQRAVMAGDRLTGLSFQVMKLKLDSGPIVFEEQVEIYPDENSLDLANRLSILSKHMICQNIKRHIDGLTVPIDQDEAKVTYASKIEKSEGLIDWSKSALEIHNQVRGLKWGPGAFTHFNEKRLKISGTFVKEVLPDILESLEPGTVFMAEEIEDFESTLFVATGDGMLGIKTLQPEGKPPQKYTDFINGYGLTQGQRFS